LPDIGCDVQHQLAVSGLVGVVRLAEGVSLNQFLLAAIARYVEEPFPADLEAGEAAGQLRSA
jgi:hypothetical protein